jgi:hypothetical protein
VFSYTVGLARGKKALFGAKTANYRGKLALKIIRLYINQIPSIDVNF